MGGCEMFKKTLKKKACFRLCSEAFCEVVMKKSLNIAHSHVLKIVAYSAVTVRV